MSSIVLYGAGYVGNFKVGDVVRFKFNTSAASGVPTTIGNSPALAVYLPGNDTEITTGVTLTVDDDSKTGTHECIVDLASGYAADTGNNSIVFTAGTVGVVSLVGSVAGEFGVRFDPSDVRAWLGGAVPTPNVTGVPIVDDKYLLGTIYATPATAGLMDVNTKQISADATAADNAELYFDGTGYGDIMVRTTIATLASQVSFTITAGSADDGTYVGALVVIEDAVTAAQKAVGVISAYTGTSKTVTLLADPAIFTMAVGDIVTIIADRSLKATVPTRTLDVESNGAIGADSITAIGTAKSTGWRPNAAIQ